MTHNAMEEELGPAQAELVDLYDRLERLLRDRSSELAPYEQRNALKALSALWQVTNGLDMDSGQIYHLGG